MEYQKYFLYRHIRLDKNEIFYVGVGTKHKKSINSKLHHVIYRRAYDKSYNRRGKIWKNITNKTIYKIEIVEESNDYKFLLGKEIECIKLYGRINTGTGILANLTDGGEGTIGIIHSLERNRKISLANKGRVRSEKEKKEVGERFGKKVINKITNEVFNNIGEAANSINIKYNTLCYQLREGLQVCKFKYLDNTLNITKNSISLLGKSGKKVIHIKTGKYYDTIKEACNDLNLIYYIEYKKLKSNHPLRNLNFIEIQEDILKNNNND